MCLFLSVIFLDCFSLSIIEVINNTIDVTHESIHHCIKSVDLIISRIKFLGRCYQK